MSIMRSISRRKKVAKHDKRNQRRVGGGAESAALPTVHCHRALLCDKAAVAHRGLHNAARHAYTSVHVSMQQCIETHLSVRDNFPSN